MTLSKVKTMAKKKLTPNQQAYNKQIKRIKAALRREEKKGFITNQIRAKLLDKPSRITQKFLETLKSITPKFIRKHSTKWEEPIQKLPTEAPKFKMPTPTDERITETTGLEKLLYTDDTTFVETPFGLQPRKQTEPEPVPTAQEPEAPEYASFSEDPYHRGGKEFTIYDEDGNVVSKIQPLYETVEEGGEEKRKLIGYVDVFTGEKFDGIKEIKEFLNESDIEERATPLEPIPDLTDYAIQSIYSQTEDLDNAVNNVMHNIFDAVRDRIGDQGFYEGMTEGNGFRSAFETLTQTLHSGGGYPEAFTKFGAKVIEDLPVTDAEAQELETAFNEIIFAAFGADVE